MKIKPNQLIHVVLRDHAIADHCVNQQWVGFFIKETEDDVVITPCDFLDQTDEDREANFEPMSIHKPSIFEIREIDLSKCKSVYKNKRRIKK